MSDGGTITMFIMILGGFVVTIILIWKLADQVDENREMLLQIKEHLGIKDEPAPFDREHPE